ncbi:MAG: hypothetical protein F4W93_05100 [Dehalococcoidia bacterium]|nr:hypothetical protein [Dehalococcoidia bacterium]
MEDRELIFAFIAVGIAVGAVAVGAICLLVGKCKIKIGTFRPQVMVVLLALSAIALWALSHPNLENVGTLAVGGLIALATRIIEKDGGAGKREK